ncbi:MAG: hypothetical protein ACYSW3_00395 [Planctomycetota bacterium]|jgi:hypothetical protein
MSCGACAICKAGDDPNSQYWDKIPNVDGVMCLCPVHTVEYNAWAEANPLYIAMRSCIDQQYSYYLNEKPIDLVSGIPAAPCTFADCAFCQGTAVFDPIEDIALEMAHDRCADYTAAFQEAARLKFLDDMFPFTVHSGVHLIGDVGDITITTNP